MNIVQKILANHLVDGSLTAGTPISIRIDQTLTQDATGTMAWLQFEALGLPSVKTELSVSYVDHNTLQMGFRNPDDHRFLRSCAAKFGAVFSPAGSGICHQLHLENFAKPGKTLLGADSHTPSAGGIGSLAIGAGGLSVATAMAGMPYNLIMPKIVRVNLIGELQGWAQAKDIILYLLKQLSVKGGVGKLFEYAGPGVKTLSIPERSTITNMGAELGATSSIFPSDDQTKAFLTAMGREKDWIPLMPDPDAVYDEEMTIDLSKIVPYAAQPHMPDRVVPVSELDGVKINQVAIGSCTNSSFADLSLVANILSNKKVNPEIDAFVSPGSRMVLSMLADSSFLNTLIESGVRLLECSCGPCIGMGSSPCSAGVSVRTFNRNFEGRSSTNDAKVYLASPATAAQCAINGMFTNPEKWGTPPPKQNFPEKIPLNAKHFQFPSDLPNREHIEIIRGPNIAPLPPFAPLPDVLEGTITLKCVDNITTDHIMPAGAEITSLRSNVPAISQYVFSRMDAEFAERQEAVKQSGKAGIIVAGSNYGQGSSREHAALAPRYLGIRAVLAKSFARIYKANLINFGILPLTFANPSDYDNLDQGGLFRIKVRDWSPSCEWDLILNEEKHFSVLCDVTEQEMKILLEGGLLNYVRNKN